MIVSRASIIEENGNKVYFDYGSVLIPQRMGSPETVYFFNKETVEEIVFKGFENYDEQQFAEQYKSIIENVRSLIKGEITIQFRLNFQIPL